MNGGKVLLIGLIHNDDDDDEDDAAADVQVYAVLREDWTLGGGHTVCAGQSDAARLVYTSTSNVVEVRLVTQPAQFLIKVERT